MIASPAADFEDALAAQVAQLIEEVQQRGALIAGLELRSIVDEQVVVSALGLELAIVALAFALDVFLNVRWSLTS